jgi:magnesium-transporting ATPase (P-type)
MIRAFCILGPVEAALEMTAFTVVLFAAGWSWGARGDPAVLMTASGSAFTAVVLGQLANAFACRSATVPPWRQGWLTNPLLGWAVLAELAVLAVCLYIGPVAALLGHLPPAPVGFAIAFLAIPAVFAADWLYKTGKRA